MIQSQVSIDETYHEMKDEDEYDLLDKKFDSLALKLEEHQSPSKIKGP